MSGSDPDVRVIIAETVSDRQECMKIRYEVFINEQGYPPNVEIDEPKDPISDHLLLLYQGRPVGTVRYTPTTHELSRFAILKEYRGKGHARLLVDHLHHVARSSGAKQVKAEVQADERPGKVDARGMYRKLGYHTRGEPYDKLGGHGLRPIKWARACLQMTDPAYSSDSARRSVVWLCVKNDAACINKIVT